MAGKSGWVPIYLEVPLVRNLQEGSSQLHVDPARNLRVVSENEMRFSLKELFKKAPVLKSYGDTYAGELPALRNAVLSFINTHTTDGAGTPLYFGWLYRTGAGGPTQLPSMPFREIHEVIANEFGRLGAGKQFVSTDLFVTPETIRKWQKQARQLRSRVSKDLVEELSRQTGGEVSEEVIRNIFNQVAEDLEGNIPPEKVDVYKRQLRRLAEVKALSVRERLKQLTGITDERLGSASGVSRIYLLPHIEGGSDQLVAYVDVGRVPQARTLPKVPDKDAISVLREGGPVDEQLFNARAKEGTLRVWKYRPDVGEFGPGGFTVGKSNVQIVQDHGVPPPDKLPKIQIDTPSKGTEPPKPTGKAESILKERLLPKRPAKLSPRADEILKGKASGTSANVPAIMRRPWFLGAWKSRAERFGPYNLFRMPAQRSKEIPRIGWVRANGGFDMAGGIGGTGSAGPQSAMGGEPYYPIVPVGQRARWILRDRYNQSRKFSSGPGSDVIDVEWRRVETSPGPSAPRLRLGFDKMVRENPSQWRILGRRAGELLRRLKNVKLPKHSGKALAIATVLGGLYLLGRSRSGQPTMVAELPPPDPLFTAAGAQAIADIANRYKKYRDEREEVLRRTDAIIRAMANRRNRKK